MERVEELLYADDPTARILARAPSFGGQELLRAYDLDLARGVLLDATRVEMTAEGAWTDVFRAVKLARLMYRITRDEEDPAARGRRAPRGTGTAPRYRVHLTGPAAGFVARPERYGHRFARVVPALVRAPGWRLEAEVLREGRRLDYRLDAASLPLEPEGSPTARAAYDSAWERSLAREFADKIGTERAGWTLHREATPVALAGAPEAGGSGRAGRDAAPGIELFLPDFTLRHADGREALVEIVGYWTPEYLEEKCRKVAAAGLDHLVLVVYRDLAAGEGGAGAGDPGSADSWEEIAPGPVVRFARKPKIGEVMEAVERVAK